MAGNGLWVKGSNEVYTHSSDNEDVWDDSALIEAYDTAVNSFKKSLKKKKNTEKNDPIRTKQKGQSCHNLKKSKSDSTIVWEIGEKCQAIYYEDGLLYDGEIIGVHDDGACTVRFDYYENEETVNDSDIFVKQNADRSSKRKSEIHKRSRNRQKNPEEAGSNVKNVPEYLNTHGEVPEQAQWDVSTEDQTTPWAVGDVCLAPVPQTGDYEEAVLLSLEGDSCCLTFTRSSVRERVPMTSLRPRFAKKRSCRHTCKHQIKEEANGRGRKSWDFPADKLPPPGFLSQHERFIPPPPPPIGIPFDADSESGNALASMLMSWYMVGFHTGYYQGICCKSNGQSPPHQQNRTDLMETNSESSSRPDVH